MEFEKVECSICLEEITDYYVVIDNVGEVGKYHKTCLDEWLDKSKNTKGILTQNPIESYSLFDSPDTFVCTIPINESHPLIPKKENSDSYTFECDTHESSESSLSSSDEDITNFEGIIKCLCKSFNFNLKF